MPRDLTEPAESLVHLGQPESRVYTETWDATDGRERWGRRANRAYLEHRANQACPETAEIRETRATEDAKVRVTPPTVQQGMFMHVAVYGTYRYR